MNKRRLLKLADLLQSDAKNKKGIKFNMCTWGHVHNEREPVSCGTEACAMGLAALSGVFKRAGLTAEVSYGRVYFKWKGRASRNGFTVAKKLFDISHEQAGVLFAPLGLSSVSDANMGAEAERAKAEQIRQFVKTGTL